MTDSPPSPSLASLIGADTSMVHDASRAYLLRLLDQQSPIVLPNYSSPIEHSQYQRLREQIATSTTLAALAGDARLETLLQQWIQLQQGYTKQVIAGVKDGVKGQQELLAVADAELREGEADREAFERLKRTAVGDLDEAGFARFQALRASVTKLDQTAVTREQLHRAVAGVSKVEQTLTTLLESSAECIHYTIPSVSEIQDRLGENKYDGPDFQPFLVFTRATVRDMFVRDVATPSLRSRNGPQKGLNMANLHPVLSELLAIYDHVMDLQAGAMIVPTDIVRSLKLKIIGAKGLASYFEVNAAAFGVQPAERKAGSRTFIRKEYGTPADRKGFLIDMLDGKLQQADAKPVNEYYFQQALALLRERPEAYSGGFTKDNVKAIAETNGLPTGRLFIARTMTTRASDFGMKSAPSGEPGVERYVFSKVIPTDMQLRYVKEAVDAFGISRFTVDDAVGKLHRLHNGYRILEKVVGVVLHEHHDGWGLKVASNDPLKYQRQDRSPGASGRSSRPAAPPGRLM